MTIAGAFYWAMLAKRERHQQMLDAIDTTNFANMKQNARRTLLGHWQTLAQGPSRQIRWEDTLTPEQRRGLEIANRETEETLRRLGKRKPKEGQKLDVGAFKKAAQKAVAGLRKEG